MSHVSQNTTDSEEWGLVKIEKLTELDEPIRIIAETIELMIYDVKRPNDTLDIIELYNWIEEERPSFSKLFDEPYFCIITYDVLSSNYCSNPADIFNILQLESMASVRKMLCETCHESFMANCQ